jgi:Ca2+-binding EF-hand superfamily protein
MLIATAQLCGEGESTGAPGGKPPGKHHQEMMQRFDKDGDGQLNDEEKAAAKSAMQQRQGEMRGEALKRFDANGDGKLDDAERAAAREAMPKERGGHMTDEQREKARAEFEAFAARHDKDGDGKLSPDERKSARDAWAAENPEKAARMRAAADKDGDGMVSDAERKEAVREMRKKHRKKSPGEPPTPPAGE